MATRHGTNFTASLNPTRPKIGAAREAVRLGAGKESVLIAVTVPRTTRIAQIKRNRGGQVKKYFEEHGYLPLFLIVVVLGLLVFAALYGERINPFDGKTWNDFNQSASK